MSLPFIPPPKITHTFRLSLSLLGLLSTLLLTIPALLRGESPVSVSSPVKTASPSLITKPIPFAGYVTMAANGAGIPHPCSTKTYTVTSAGRSLQIPEAMVFVPAGDFAMGSGANATRSHLDAYCIGKFHVTNAEFKAYLDGTGSHNYPKYWPGGMYPEGKANHPVVFVSLTQAQAYADWVSQQTGWKVGIPSAGQWEKAARGPSGFLYPWGDTLDCTYRDGVLRSHCSFNAVTAARYLKSQPKLEVTYNHPQSNYYGTKATVDRIAGYGSAGEPSYLDISPNGAVRGWVSHATYTGFIYTDLFTRISEAGGDTASVGSYEDGKSGYGGYDMAGNVWDWCSTIITATNGAEKGREVNEILGGSWYATGSSCRSVSIGEGRAATGAYNTVGFRLVMIPPLAK